MANEQQLGVMLSRNLADVTIEKCAYEALENARHNLPYCSRSIFDLKGVFSAEKLKSAIVIAAGPSLHRQEAARKIKESGYKGLLIATESAMAYCLRNGLVPHLIVTLDPHAKRIVRFFGDSSLTADDLKADDYFARQDLDPEFGHNQLRYNVQLLEIVNKYGPGIKAAVATCASRKVVDRCLESGMELFWWNPLYDDYKHPDSLTRVVYELNRLPCLNAVGNVGTACWVIAHSVLEIPEVALVGMDLSYYSGTEYRQTQYYYELLELVGEERLKEAFIYIENPYLNSTWFTDPTYYWYRQAFLEMVTEALCRTYNCTEGGILFGESIEFIALDHFLKTH